MKKDKIAAALVIFAILVVLFSISWLITCGIIKLITLCFGLVFSWKIATGFWLILFLVGTFTKNNVKIN